MQRPLSSPRNTCRWSVARTDRMITWKSCRRSVACAYVNCPAVLPLDYCSPIPVLEPTHGLGLRVESPTTCQLFAIGRKRASEKGLTVIARLGPPVRDCLSACCPLPSPPPMDCLTRECDRYQMFDSVLLVFVLLNWIVLVLTFTRSSNI